MADFERASRIKLRFDTALGLLSAEDLWDLPLTSETGRPNLDDIARDLHKRLQDVTVSFVEPKSSDETDQIRFDIVKHVIDVKVAKRERAKQQKELAERRKRILEIKAEKDDEELRRKAGVELDAELARLDEELAGL